MSQSCVSYTRRVFGQQVSVFTWFNRRWSAITLIVVMWNYYLSLKVNSLLNKRELLAEALCFFVHHALNLVLDTNISAHVVVS